MLTEVAEMLPEGRSLGQLIQLVKVSRHYATSSFHNRVGGGDESAADEGAGQGKERRGEGAEQGAIVSRDSEAFWACWRDCLNNEEAINTLFCPFQEKFHTFVLRGLRNISVNFPLPIYIWPIFRLLTEHGDPELVRRD